MIGEFCIIRFPGEETAYISDLGTTTASITPSAYADGATPTFIIKTFDKHLPDACADCDDTEIPVELHIPCSGRCDVVTIEKLLPGLLPVMEANTLKIKESLLPDPTPGEHRDLVERCRDMLRELGRPAKVVLARTKTVGIPAEKQLSLFMTLLRERMDACVFLYSSPATGTWMGATPELLLSCRDNRIESVALAGTRKARKHQLPWDDKNIEEQALVTSQICDDFIASDLHPCCEGPSSRRAGNVEHIITEIYARTPAEWREEDTLRLADRLAPTPALAGFPREMALRFIDSNEKIRRLCYGGYIGLTDGIATRLYVNLRSAILDPAAGEARLYAGGGITAMSDPDEEVSETEDKFKWLTRTH